MTERKVLNKYFPPDYDPSKIPRLFRGRKGRSFNIRTMAPFNMRCNTCNGYIYKAKKFNSKMEVAEDIEYLGLRHYRFYIRCSTCCAEIIWRTDLESGDYTLESGAKRNFEALKTAEEQEAKAAAEEEEELKNNPMKLLEKRTEQSKREMDMVEILEDLREINKRHAGLDADRVLLRKLWEEKDKQETEEIQQEEKFIKEVFSHKQAQINPEFKEELIHEVSLFNPNRLENLPKVKKLPEAFNPETNLPNTKLKRQLLGLVVQHKPTINSISLPSTSKTSGSHQSSIQEPGQSSITPLPPDTVSSDKLFGAGNEQIEERVDLSNIPSKAPRLESDGHLETNPQSKHAVVLTTKAVDELACTSGNLLGLEYYSSDEGGASS